MAIEATPVAQPAYDEWRDRRWTLTGRILVLLWLVAVLTILLVGERRSDLGRLHSGLADGSITEVEVTGLPDGGVRGGSATVQLEWSSRFLDRYTQVVVVPPGRSDRPIDSDALPVVAGDPVAVMQQLQPDVEIAWTEPRSGTYWEAGGWLLRGIPGSMVALLVLATLFLLLGGPQPWRATRWAWFWMLLAAPLVAAVAYALLGGPLAAGQPADRTRRLSGGWAFLIAIFVLGGFGAS